MRFNETFMNCVRKDLRAGSIVMLLGEPGIGKSSWTEDLARLEHTKCFTVRCNQLADKADLTGARLVPYEKDDGSTGYMQCFYPHETIMRCVDYAQSHPDERPILFLDELNRTPSDVTSALLSIPTDRAVGNVRLPDNIIVMCAGNDRGNVTSLDEASISRFALYRMQPDVDTFLALDPELNPFIKTVLENHPETLFGKTVVSIDEDGDSNHDYSLDDIIDGDDGMAQITTPRTISKLSKWLNLHTNNELMALLAETDTVAGETISVLQEQVEAHVGRTAFAALLLGEIAANISNSSNQSNVITVLEPDVFCQLTAASDFTTLAQIVGSLSEKQRSACLLFALQDPHDHSAIIQQLTSMLDNFDSDDLKSLMQLIGYDKLDDRNVATFLRQPAPIVDRIGFLLDTAN